MDHRSANTKKKIRTTYFAMLMNKEPINVRSLVKKANINKSTFYRYYPYIDALEDELLHELVDEIYEKAKNGDSPDFLVNFFNFYENEFDPKKKALFKIKVQEATKLLADLALEEFKKRHPGFQNDLGVYILAYGCLSVFIDKRYTTEERKKAIVGMGKLFHYHLQEK